VGNLHVFGHIFEEAGKRVTRKSCDFPGKKLLQTDKGDSRFLRYVCVSLQNLMLLKPRRISRVRNPP
jgi:hypothetical protein